MGRNSAAAPRSPARNECALNKSYKNREKVNQHPIPIQKIENHSKSILHKIPLTILVHSELFL